MFKVLYEKKYDREQFDGKIVFDHTRAICPNCSKVIKEVGVGYLPETYVFENKIPRVGEIIGYLPETSIDEYFYKDEAKCVETATMIGNKHTYHAFRCPHCDEIIYGKKKGLPYWVAEKNAYSRKKVDEFMKDKKTFPVISISHPTEDKIYEAITHDEEAGKITMYTAYNDYRIVPNTLVTTIYYCKVILNYKKHTAYLILDKQAKNGKLLKSSAAIRVLTNVTGYYQNNFYMTSINSKFSRELTDRFAKMYFEVIKLPISEHFSKYESMKKENVVGDMVLMNNNQDLISKLIAINRYPNIALKYDSYRNEYEMIDTDDSIYHQSFLNIMPKEICDYQEWVRSVIKKHGLPSSKYFWTKYMTNPIYLNNVFYLRKCGFENGDVMRRLLEDGTFIKNTTEIDYYTKKLMKETQNVSVQIVKRMLKEKPETAVANKLMSQNKRRYGKSEFKDMIHMYTKVKNQDKSLLNSVNWGGTISEIHDDLSLIVTKIQYANRIIKYKKEDLAFEKTIGGCEFKLAVDTNELVKIGQELRICVGSYRERALNRFSIILSVKKDEKYVGCIELDNAYNLVQVKGRCNSWLYGEIGEATKKWTANTPVRSKDNCYDYTHIGLESNGCCEHDYHRLELNEDGEVVDAQERRVMVHDWDAAAPFNFNANLDHGIDELLWDNGVAEIEEDDVWPF